MVMTGLVIWCSFDPKIDSKPGWLTLIHMVTELATSFNVVVVMIYWSVLHNLAIETMSKEENPDVKCLHMYLVHTFPIIANLLVLSTMDVKFATYHWKAFIPIALVYGTINCFTTLKSGKPLYYFLDWKDYKTPLILIAITAVFALLFV